MVGGENKGKKCLSMVDLKYVAGVCVREDFISLDGMNNKGIYYLAYNIKEKNVQQTFFNLEKEEFQFGVLGYMTIEEAREKRISWEKIFEITLNQLRVEPVTKIFS